MKKKFLFFCLFSSFIAFSQTPNEIKKIVSTYNSDSINYYINYFKEENFNRLERLKNYFDENEISSTFYKNGNLFQIYDVKDNDIIYAQTLNAGSSSTIKANRLYNGGSLGLNIQGQNMTVAVWDAGSARITHNEFPNNKVVASDFASDNLHATHVTGTIVAQGIQANVRGIAFDALANSYDWNDDITEMTTAASNGLLISNHSYWIGSSLSTWILGAYDIRARTLDIVCSQATNYLPVVAAGNDRNDFSNTVLGPHLNQKGGFNLIRGQANAKNVMTVGAVEQVSNYTGPSSVNMSTFSSWGPTDDGRIKPDIVAKGVLVRSTLNTSDSATGFLDGTSMASPAVSGGLLLLQQYHNTVFNNYMKAATLKSLALHSADEAGFYPGPDYMFGWGLFNIEKAANIITKASQNIEIIEENALNTGLSYTKNIATDGLSPLMASIGWTDRPGSANSTNLIDPENSNLINDLDIRIFKDGIEYFPWTLDPSSPSSQAVQSNDNFRDNFEKIQIDNPVAGIYQISVTHKGNLVGNLQNYTLIVSGSNQTLSIDKFNNENISIYPNPTNNSINISSQNEPIINFVIYDLQGRKVDSNKMNSIYNFSVDLSNFNSGIYIIELNSENGKYSQKIVKK